MQPGLGPFLHIQLVRPDIFEKASDQIKRKFKANNSTLHLKRNSESILNTAFKDIRSSGLQGVRKI